MDNLNEQQKYAATFNGKHLLVLAGAGTGKTRTIIARAKHLIQSGVHPKKILILSFTRKSAGEIVERIKRELSDTVSEGLSGSTFHSWCMAIIKNNPHIFPQASYTLLDEEDQISCFRYICGNIWFLKDANQELIKPKDLVSVYSFMINTQCSLSDAIRMKIFNNAPESTDVSALLPDYKDVINEYIKYKKQRNYLDYDDILLIVSKYLKRNENLRLRISNLYEHILIDEMQDTNPLQYELLSSFYNNCHLFCVGDDAQSIYGFRGADFQTIHKFPEIVKDSEVCKLTLNYRSTQEILDLANWVLSNSPLNYDKQLTAVRGSGSTPAFIHWADDWEQNNDIAFHIIDSVKSKNKKFKDNLILSRTLYGVRPIEISLLKHKIPYVVFGGLSIFSSRHIRDIISALRIVSNFQDEIAWTRYLQLWNNIGPKTASGIIMSVLNEKSLDDSLITLMDEINTLGYNDAIYNTLITISNLQNKPSEAIKNAFICMEKRLEELYQNHKWETRKNDFPLMEEIAKSSSSISDFIAEYILNPSLGDTHKNGGEKKDSVILSTIHSAKGLEADIVYLINASTDSFPTQRAILNGENAVEEERRCLYVALTRAKDEMRVYRNINSIHVVNGTSIAEDESKYFFNFLPENLYESKVLTSHHSISSEVDFNTQIQDDIYSDLDLT